MFDLIIKNAKIIDGREKEAFKADLAVKDGKIAEIGELTDCDASEIFDAEGLYLAPGFIDIHCHTDETILNNRLSENRILQGVTTEFGGNCGISVAPVDDENRDLLRQYVGDLPFNWTTLGDYLNIVEEDGISTNLGTGVGHGSLRIAAMGFDNRKPEPEEMEKMKALLRQSMEDGAFFVSSGLIYPPGFYSDEEEMAELIAEVKPYGGFYATHMRNEGLDVVNSVKEALRVAEKAGVPLEISHHKVSRKQKWYTACKETTALIQAAIDKGQDVMCDQYPYNASSTTLDSNVPDWAFEGGVNALLKRLEDPELRAKMREESNKSHEGRWGDIYIGYAQSEKNAWTIGKNILEIAEIRGVDPADACFDLIYEEKSRVNEINYGMCEEDIEWIMKQPFTCTGSDGWGYSLDAPGMPHPRSFAAFPRVIAHYSRDRQLFPLETAVYKMTGLPAKRLGLKDRGIIAKGNWADLVLFDYDKINDDPTYNNPKQPCSGIERVYVNGILTAEKGVHTGAKAGLVLRKGINA